MLQSGSDNQLTFNLDLVGTTISPVVRVLLHLSPTTLLFPAKHVEGSKWSVNLALPDVDGGRVKFSIEVLLGNRLFVPLSDEIEIENIKVSVTFDNQALKSSFFSPVSASVKIDDVVPEEIAPSIVEPAAAEEVEQEPAVVEQEVQEAPAPVEPAPIIEPVVPKPAAPKPPQKNLLQSVISIAESEETAGIKRIQRLAGIRT